MLGIRRLLGILSVYRSGSPVYTRLTVAHALAYTRTALRYCCKRGLDSPTSSNHPACLFSHHAGPRPRVCNRVLQTPRRNRYAARAAPSAPGASRAELESMLARKEAELASMFEAGRPMPRVHLHIHGSCSPRAFAETDTSCVPQTCHAVPG